MNFKNIYFNLFLTLLLSSCIKLDNKVNTLEKIGLNGDIKSIELKSYLAIERFGNIEIGKREIEEYSWFKDYEKFFNDDGYIIEKNFYDLDDNLTLKATIKYDDNFNIIENNHYNSDGSLLEKTVWKYDEKRNNIKTIGYNSSGNIKNTFISKYNNLNQVIEEKYIDSTQNVLSKNKYKYDSRQNRVEEISYYKGSFSDKREMEYNSKNKLTSLTIYNSKSSVNQKWIQKYDNNDLLQEVNYFDSDNEIFRKEKFEYDKKNNWIKKIIYINNKPAFVIKKTIEYKK